MATQRGTKSFLSYHSNELQKRLKRRWQKLSRKRQRVARYGIKNLIILELCLIYSIYKLGNTENQLNNVQIRRKSIQVLFGTAKCDGMSRDDVQKTLEAFSYCEPPIVLCNGTFGILSYYTACAYPLGEKSRPTGPMCMR